VLAELIEGHDADVEASVTHVTTAPKDGSRKVNINLKSGETPPDRAWIEMWVFNEREVA
jgi:hypothetical protein